MAGLLKFEIDFGCLNGWCEAEVYVLSSSLLEQMPPYNLFKNHLASLGLELPSKRSTTLSIPILARTFLFMIAAKIVILTRK